MVSKVALVNSSKNPDPMGLKKTWESPNTGISHKSLKSKHIHAFLWLLEIDKNFTPLKTQKKKN